MPELLQIPESHPEDSAIAAMEKVGRVEAIPHPHPDIKDDGVAAILLNG